MAHLEPSEIELAQWPSLDSPRSELGNDRRLVVSRSLASSGSGATQAEEEDGPLLASTGSGQERLECSLCLEDRRYLKLLPCRHCFCEYCLQRLVNNHLDAFPCPLCRKTIAIPASGASGFRFCLPGTRSGVGVSQIMEAFRGGARNRRHEQGRCEECKEETGGILVCFHCQKTLCCFCCYRHVGGDDHHGNFEDSLQTPHQKMCQRHKFQDLTHYCENCEELLCAICVRAGNSAHKAHDINILDEAAEKAMKKLKAVLRKAERCSRRLQSACQHFVQQQHDLAKEVSEAENGIRQRAAEIRALADTCERDALASLGKLGERLSKNLAANISSVQCKTAALCAVQTQIKGVVLADIKIETILTDVRSNETIGKDAYFEKYVQDLPTADCTIELKPDLFKNVDQTVKNWIGLPAIRKFPNKPATVLTLETHGFLSNDRSPMNVNFVCPVSETKTWLGWEDNDGKSTASLYHVVKDVVMKQQTSDKSVVLTRLDAHVVLAQYKNHEALLCLEGRSVLYPVERSDFFITNKGQTRACLFYTSSGRKRSSYLTLRLTSGFEARVDGYKDRAVPVPDLQVPMKMDISEDRKLVVVVDEKHVLRLYKIDPDFRNVCLLETVDPCHDLNRQVTDVCFYRLGRQQVLLLADPSQDDVVVVDCQHQTLRLLGFLTNRSGSLRHPSALDVHPSNGLLYVTCQYRTLAVCGDTGVDMQSTGV